MANLCRRSGLPEKSLKLLLPAVSPRRLKFLKSSVEEIAEYSGALIQLGALGEAEARLALCQQEDPDILLQKAFCSIRQWDYQKALTSLTLFNQKTSGYYQLVGLINQAAAHVHLKNFNEAGRLLANLQSETLKAHAMRLHVNATELLAQNAVNRGAFDEAEDSLAKLDTQSVGETQESLYAFKWRLILDFEKQNGPANKSPPTKAKRPSTNALSSPLRARLKALRAMAIKMRDFETLRDSDRIEALYLKDQKIFLKVYCGTPFLAYRQHLRADFEKAFGHPFSEPPLYSWQLSGGAGAKKIRELNLSTGKVADSDTRLKAKQLFLRSLLVLSRDFYKGVEIAAFHDQVFEGDYYNPYTSPNRVHQSVKRLNMFLSTHLPGVTVTHSQNQYHLQADAPTRIVLSLKKCAPLSADLELVLRKFRDDNFKVRDVQAAIAKSLRMANRVIAEGINCGRLRAHGLARRRRYSVVS